MKSTPLALAAAALAIAASQPAFALRCGDVLYQSVTLSGDVVCAPDEYGLVVAASGVRVDLNGFKISGSPASVGFTVGIMAVNLSGVEIVGPGTIQDFTYAITLNEGGKHRVSGVKIVRGGVLLSNVRDSVVERSELPHVHVGTRFGGKAYYNRIVDNEFHATAPPNPLQFYVPPIEIAGCGTEKNLVTGNRMSPPPPTLGPGFSIMVYGGASNNVVSHNTFTRSVFIGNGANGNEVAKNVITVDAQSSFAGVEIASGNLPCTGGGWMGSSNNRVIENEINQGTFGVAVRSLPGASSSNNKIQGNTISGPLNAGLAFSFGSDNNDARQNRINAPVHAIDYGTGNLWP